MAVVGVNEPSTHKGVVLHQHQDWMHTTGLQTRSHEQRGVEARAHLVVQHLTHQANTLSVLESSRRRVVDDATSCQSLIDRPHNGPHTVRVLRLVFVERIISRQLAQHLRCIHQHRTDFGCVRSNESREQFRFHRHALPVVHRQQFHAVVLLQQHFLAHAHLQRHGGFDTLGQCQQLGSIGLHLQVGDVNRATCINPTGTTHCILQQFATDFHHHVFQPHVAQIGHIAPFHATLAIVHHGIIHFLQVFKPCFHFLCVGHIV